MRPRWGWKRRIGETHPHDLTFLCPFSSSPPSKDTSASRTGRVQCSKMNHYILSYRPAQRVSLRCFQTYRILETQFPGKTSFNIRRERSDVRNEKLTRPMNHREKSSRTSQAEALRLTPRICRYACVIGVLTLGQRAHKKPPLEIETEDSHQLCESLSQSTSSSSPSGIRSTRNAGTFTRKALRTSGPLEVQEGTTARRSCRLLPIPQGAIRQRQRYLRRGTCHASVPYKQDNFSEQIQKKAGERKESGS